jgi:hypothetical protein
MIESQEAKGQPSERPQQQERLQWWVVQLQWLRAGSGRIWVTAGLV